MLSRVLPSAVYTGILRVPFAFMTCLFVTICFLSTVSVVKRNSEQQMTNNPQCERSIRCLQISSVLEIMRNNEILAHYRN